MDFQAIPRQSLFLVIWIRFPTKLKICMYAIVKFIDEGDAPGIICTKWIASNRKFCYYPNVRTNEARDKLLRKSAQPADDWISCRIKILHKYNSFSEALTNLSKAEETSNLESEDESSTRRKKKPRFTYSDEESGEEDLPNFGKCSSLDPFPVPTTASYSAPLRPNSHVMPPIQSFFERTQHKEHSIAPTVSETPNLLPSAKSLASSSTTNQIYERGELMAWLSGISEKIAKLDEKCETILKNQEILLKNGRNEKTESFEREEDLEMLSMLPIPNDSTFQELNKKISQEAPFRHLLVKVLMSVGGKDMRSHIHNMLRRLLSDEVAELYSLSGKSTLKDSVKKSFLATEAAKSIFSACQRVFKDVATDVNVKEAMGDWLNQAKVRKNRRLQRQEKNSERNLE